MRPIFTLGNYVRLFNLQLSSIYVSLFLGITTTILNVIVRGGHCLYHCAQALPHHLQSA